MLKEAIGTPGLTLKFLFQSLQKPNYFSLIGEHHEDLHTTIRDNLVGGPAVVFHRYAKKGETFIRGGPHKVASVVGYDANSLYSWCLAQSMPTLNPIRRQSHNNFRAQEVDKYGVQAHEWLTYIQETDPSVGFIHHKFNGKQKLLGDEQVVVSGWSPSSRTVFQFQGCYQQGHQCELTHGQTTNALNGKSFEQLRQKEKEKFAYITDTLHLNLQVMRECQWQSFKAAYPELNPFFATHCPKTKTPFHYDGRGVTTQSIVQAVRDEKLFGLVECDLQVPTHLRDHMAEYQPIFKNVNVGLEDIGQHMREFAEQHGLLKQPRRTLVGSFWAKQILLTTPLLKWYLDHGLEVTHIYQTVEYTPSKCFESFVEFTANARRAADKDPEKNKILGDSAKLLANSAYGKTITNVSKFTTVIYSAKKDTPKHINNPRFHKAQELNHCVDECELLPAKIKWDLPNTVGFAVYCYAKLRMLEFYYDCLQRFVPRERFQLLETDTDSLYLSLATDSLDEAVSPHLKREFFQEYPKWFPALACDKHADHFVEAKCAGQPWTPTLPCCKDRVAYDKRRPGLMKLEWKGDSMICLCPKTYYATGPQGDKKSSKGLSHSNTLTFDDYARVIQHQTSGVGQNRSFRTDGQTMLTYFQERSSLSYLYLKRRILDDKVSSEPTLV